MMLYSIQKKKICFLEYDVDNKCREPKIFTCDSPQQLNKNLEKLDKNKNFESGIYFYQFKNYLKYMKNLKEIIIINNNFLNDNLLFHISKLSKLEKLEIPFCNTITNEGIKYLVKNNKLRLLDLRFNRKITCDIKNFFSKNVIIKIEK